MVDEHCPTLAETDRGKPGPESTAARESCFLSDSNSYQEALVWWSCLGVGLSLPRILSGCVVGCNLTTLLFFFSLKIACRRADVSLAWGRLREAQWTLGASLCNSRLPSNLDVDGDSRGPLIARVYILRNFLARRSETLLARAFVSSTFRLPHPRF